MTRKRGFTLTEILITLGIIGVLAAITIPRLFNNTKDAHIGAQLSSAISAIETGAGMYLYEKGVKNTDYLNTEIKPSVLLSELARKYVKMASATPPSNMKSGNNDIKCVDNTTYTLPDRSLICVTSNTTLTPDHTGTSDAELAFISSKSTKQKSLLEGYDFFRMSISAEGLIYLPGLDYETNAACTQGTGGKGCAGKIAQNGWKLDYTNL